MRKVGPEVIKRQAAKPSGISEKVIRLLEIYTMVGQGQFPSVPFLKKQFHVSERSVCGYLEIINMIEGVEFDQERKGYRFTNGDRIKKLASPTMNSSCSLPPVRRSRISVNLSDGAFRS